MSLKTMRERGVGEKRKRRKINLRLVLGLIIGLGLIFGLIFLPKILFKGEAPPETPPSEKVKVTLTKAQILTIVSKEPIIKDFIARNPTYETKISFLDKEDLEKLSSEQPAIYAELPKDLGLYKVEYNTKDKNEGVLLIFDPMTRRVLKYYRMRRLEL